MAFEKRNLYSGGGGGRAMMVHSLNKSRISLSPPPPPPQMNRNPFRIYARGIKRTPN